MELYFVIEKKLVCWTETIRCSEGYTVYGSRYWTETKHHRNESLTYFGPFLSDVKASEFKDLCEQKWAKDSYHQFRGLYDRDYYMSYHVESRQAEEFTPVDFDGSHSGELEKRKVFYPFVKLNG